MQRYFSNNKENNAYVLSNDDSYHIEKVMRMNIKDKIEIVCDKTLYICEIISFKPVKAKIVQEIKENNEEEKKIILVQSLINENKIDYVLQKGTELGVSEFWFYKATNSIIKENDKKEKKLLRWQKIVKESSEQSKRNIIPIVRNIIDIKGLCNLEGDLKLLLTVNEKTRFIKNILQENKNYDTIIIVVGPEGGFTSFEEEELVNNAYVSTSLGKRILRTETAGVIACAMINYEWMV